MLELSCYETSVGGVGSALVAVEGVVGVEVGVEVGASAGRGGGGGGGGGTF